MALFLHKIPDNAHLTVNDWNAIEKVMLELMEVSCFDGFDSIIKTVFFRIKRR